MPFMFPSVINNFVNLSILKISVNSGLIEIFLFSNCSTRGRCFRVN